MEEFIISLNPELLALVPMLCGLGVLLKKTKLKDNFIPFVLIGAAIVLSVVYCLATADTIVAQTVFAGIFQGVLLGSATVGGHQCFKQVSKM